MTQDLGLLSSFYTKHTQEPPFHWCRLGLSQGLQRERGALETPELDSNHWSRWTHKGLCAPSRGTTAPSPGTPGGPRG